MQLGAELGLYQAGELAGAYFYLMYLAETRLHHVQRISSFVLASGDGRGRDGAAALRHTVAVLQVRYHELSATMFLAKALYELLTALAWLGLLPAVPPADAYSSDALRHQLRLRPFLALGHPPVPPPELFPSSRPPTTDPEALRNTVLEQLDLVDAVARAAREAWDKVLKSEPAAAQCVGCEDAWRASVRQVLKSRDRGRRGVCGGQEMGAGGREGEWEGDQGGGR